MFKALFWYLPLHQIILKTVCMPRSPQTTHFQVHNFQLGKKFIFSLHLKEILISELEFRFRMKTIMNAFQNVHCQQRPLFPGIHPLGGGGEGDGGTQRPFIRGGSAPRSNLLPFYIPFLTEKVPLLYTVEPLRMATLRTEESGHCREVETSSKLYGLSAPKKWPLQRGGWRWPLVKVRLYLLLLTK